MAELPLRLLQFTLAAPQLEPVVAALERALGLEVAFRDPGVAIFGLENAVLPMRDTFLEVVAPVREGTAAGRFLARRGGPGGYMVILQVADLAPHRRRVEGEGVRIAWEGRAAPSGEGGPSWEGMHLHPADTGAAMLSLDRPDPPDSWVPAGLAWRDHVRGDVATGLRAVVLESPEPERLAARWGAVLGRAVDGGGCLRLDGGGSLRFRPGPGERVAAVEIEASPAAGARSLGEIGGVDFELVEPGSE